MFGVLLAEDLTAVVELAILTTLASGASVSASLMTVTVARLILFLVAFVGIGFIVVPPVVRFVVRMGRPETTLVAVVGICFAFSMLAEHAGYSVALGAFLAGSLVAESGEAAQIEHLVAPLRDIFGAVFFVSVGMMIDPALIQQHWQALIVLTAAVVGGKIIGVTFASMLSGVGTKTSIEAGMSMSQIGEFSFIIAGAGLKTRRHPRFSLHARRRGLRRHHFPDAVHDSRLDSLGRIRFRADAASSSRCSRRSTTRGSSRFATRDSRRSEANSIGWPIASIVCERGSDRRDSDRQRTRSARRDEHGREHSNICRISRAGLYVDLFALLLCALPAAAMYFASRRLAAALASRAFAELPPSGAPAVNALVELLQITILLVAAVPLLAIVQPFMAPVEGIGIIVITHRADDRRGDTKRAPDAGSASQCDAPDRHRAPRRSRTGGRRVIRSPRHRNDHARPAARR